MTIIEGYVDKRYRKDVGLVSVSTTRAQYGGAETEMH